METDTIHHDIKRKRACTSREQNLEQTQGGNGTMPSGGNVGGASWVRGLEGGEDLWPEPGIIEIARQDADGDIREKQRGTGRKNFPFSTFD